MRLGLVFPETRLHLFLYLPDKGMLCASQRNHVFFLILDIWKDLPIFPKETFKWVQCTARGKPNEATKPSSSWVSKASISLESGQKLGSFIHNSFLNLKGEALGKENKKSAILGVNLNAGAGSSHKNFHISSPAHDRHWSIIGSTLPCTVYPSLLAGEAGIPDGSSKIIWSGLSTQLLNPANTHRVNLHQPQGEKKAVK